MRTIKLTLNERTITVIVASEDPTPSRVRQRTVAGPEWYGTDLARKALATGEWQATCEHGGTVPNSYRYPAETSTVVAVASPDGTVVVWYGRRIPANKATLSGAAAACLSRIAAIWDGRVGEQRKREAWAALHAAHRAVVESTIPELVVARDAEMLGRTAEAAAIREQVSV